MANERLPWWLLRSILIGRAASTQGSNTAVDDEPPDMLDDWLLADIGDRIDRINALAEHPTEDVRLELEGYTETIRHRGWAAQLNAEPYDPWAIGMLAGISDPSDILGRLAGDDNAALRVAVDSDDLSFPFDPNAFRWTIYGGLVLTGNGSYAYTPDSSQLDITGDIDVRADVTLTNWNPGSFQSIVAKYHTGGAKSYDLGINNTGFVSLFWSNDGSADLNADSTARPTPDPVTGRLALRATLDVDNGAAGKTVTFYTAPTLAGPWVQLGSIVTTAGTTSIFSSTAILEIGSDESGAFDRVTGTVHSAQVRSGIDGTIVANPDFSAQAIGTTTFSDSAGLTWTLTGTAAFDSDFPMDVRLGGEVVTVSGITTTPATFVAAGTVAHANNASVTPSLPAGVVANDLLLIFAAIRNSGTGIPDTPAGYTRLPVFGAGDNCQLFAKVHSGSESNPTVTFTGGVANADTSAQMSAIRNMPISFEEMPGSHTLAEIVLDAKTQLNGSAQDIAFPGIPAMPYPGCVVLALGWKQDDWTSVATVSGFTEIDEPDTTTGDDQGIVWDIVIQTSPAVILPGSFTVTGGASAISRSAVVRLAGGFQTMTVSARSVNGVVKAHFAGTPIEVDDVLVLGL